MHGLHARIGLLFGASIAWGAFVSAWPMLGMFEDGYVYSNYVCFINFQRPVTGGLYLASVSIMAVCLVLGLRPLLCAPPTTRGTHRRCLCLVIVVVAVFSHSLPIALTLDGFSGYTSCARFTWSRKILPLIGGVFMHVTSLANVTFMIAWRRELGVDTYPPTAGKAQIISAA